MKVPLQLHGGVQRVAAIGAERIGAGHVTQFADQPCRIRELLSHPGRQDRIAARNPQPRQHIDDGKLQGRVGQIVVEQLLQACAADFQGGIACVLVQHLPNGLVQHGGGQLSAPVGALGRHWLYQPRQRAEQVFANGCLLRCLVLQRLQGHALVLEEGPAGQAVGQGRILRRRDELVVLDQPVVGVLWKGDGREAQRIDDRQVVQVQPGCGLLQDGQIMGDEVVAHHMGGAQGQPFQFGQRSLQVGRLAKAGALETLAGIGSKGTDLPQAAPVGVEGKRLSACVGRAAPGGARAASQQGGQPFPACAQQGGEAAGRAGAFFGVCRGTGAATAGCLCISGVAVREGFMGAAVHRTCRRVGGIGGCRLVRWRTNFQIDDQNGGRLHGTDLEKRAAGWCVRQDRRRGDRLPRSAGRVHRAGDLRSTAV